MQLTAKAKYSYGIGALGKDLVYGIVGTYLMIYFTDTIGLAPAFVGTLFLIARIWDTVNDPMMGMVVDNTRTKWGKFRPWILIGTLINAIVLFFLFKKPDLDGLPLYAYFSVMYILWGMTYTIMDIPYWSMIPSLTQDKAEREKVAVIPRIFASIGGLTIGTFGLTFVAKLGQGNDVKGYESLAFIIAVIFIVSSLITCINVKEPSTKTADKTTKKAERVTLKQTFKIIGQNDQLKVFIGVVLCMNLMLQLLGGMALYYFKYATGNEGMFKIYNGFAGFAEIGGLLLFPILAQKIGRQKLFKVGCFVPVIGLIGLLVSGIWAPDNALLVILSALLVRGGGGFVLASTTVMLADVVDYGEYKLGTRNESIIFSCQTLLVKSASAFSGWAIGVGLQMMGYVANQEQSAGTIMGMRSLMTIAPIIFIVLCFAIYKKYYKLNGDFHEEVLNELEARNNLKELEARHHSGVELKGAAVQA